jgi:quercetin dioxygenase-like cupin family protein
MATGWFAAVCANVQPGMTVAVVGDGAVGLLGVLSAAGIGADRIIAMSSHEPRQQLAREFGATDIVAERADDGVARIKDLTGGVGADAVLECVGTSESMTQARRSTRPGGFVGLVGVPHGVSVDGEELFYSHVAVRGGPVPARRFLPELIDLVCDRKIDPGRVFDLTLPLGQVAEGLPRDGRAAGYQNPAPSMIHQPDQRRKHMQVQPKQPTAKGPAEWFTGDVWIDAIARGHSSAPLSIGSVHFTPCARTAWHQHSIGQTLYVTEGEGRVQSRGGTAVTIRPGDVVRPPGGEWHWHGAAHDHFLTHLSFTEGDTEWGGHVDDGER